MKSWHVLVLAGSILAAGGAIAAVQVFGPQRYHYTVITPSPGLTRVDSVTGNVQVYDARLAGWVDLALAGR